MIDSYVMPRTKKDIFPAISGEYISIFLEIYTSKGVKQELKKKVISIGLCFITIMIGFILRLVCMEKPSDIYIKAALFNESSYSYTYYFEIFHDGSFVATEGVRNYEDEYTDITKKDFIVEVSQKKEQKLTEEEFQCLNELVEKADKCEAFSPDGVWMDATRAMLDFDGKLFSYYECFGDCDDTDRRIQALFKEIARLSPIELPEYYLRLKR